MTLPKNEKQTSALPARGSALRAPSYGPRPTSTPPRYTPIRPVLPSNKPQSSNSANKSAQSTGSKYTRPGSVMSDGGIRNGTKAEKGKSSGSSKHTSQKGSVMAASQNLSVYSQVGRVSL